MAKTVILQRTLENQITQKLFKKGIITILGPRQSGKTTLSKKIISTYGEKAGYYNCELFEVRNCFLLGQPEKIKLLIGSKSLVVFDEAQTIENIGKILKVFYDTYPQIQVIATGSSSFDLSNKIKEPLTGRAYEFTLPPLSFKEIQNVKKVTSKEFENILLYGMYPAVMLAMTDDDKLEELKKIATNYLYKDIFIFESLRNTKAFEDLLIHLAQSVGSTVSSNKIAQDLGVAQATVEKYIRLLEQSFVIKRIYSYSRNYANELKKSYKIYFYDTGVINVLLNTFDLASNKGALFENFFFMEKLKGGLLEIIPPRIHFWRTKKGEEVDFVITENGVLKAYECKYTKEDVSFSLFKKRYTDAVCMVVSASDYILN